MHIWKIHIKILTIKSFVFVFSNLWVFATFICFAEYYRIICFLWGFFLSSVHRKINNYYSDWKYTTIQSTMVSIYFIYYFHLIDHHVCRFFCCCFAWYIYLLCVVIECVILGSFGRARLIGRSPKWAKSFLNIPRMRQKSFVGRDETKQRQQYWWKRNKSTQYEWNVRDT